MDSTGDVTSSIAVANSKTAGTRESRLANLVPGECELVVTSKYADISPVPSVQSALQQALLVDDYQALA
jgi:hypothetical protein